MYQSTKIEDNYDREQRMNLVPKQENKGKKETGQRNKV